MERIVDESNVRRAIAVVNSRHKQSVCRWVEDTIEERIKDLQAFAQDPDWEASPPRVFAVYDKSARKWRNEVCEPALWPDQYLHHMVIQALEPILMKGMDPYCCGSIPGRGISYGMNGIEKWMKQDPKGTRYASELDITSFYDSIDPKVVIRWLATKIKDRKALRLVWKLIKFGIKIGFYISQWMANAMLQPLDHFIREVLDIPHYIRYIDNITIFASSKRKLHKAVRAIAKELEKIGLRLKRNWQVFKVDIRAVSALGYRFDHHKVLLRKKNLLRLKRQLGRAYRKIANHRKIPFSMAAGLISRIGQLKHCNSANIRKRLIQPGLVKVLKNIIREEARRRKETALWIQLMCSPLAM